MTAEIERYFAAERAESWLFIAIGVVAISFAVYLLWRHGNAVSKGLAIPLIAVGLIQIVVGGTVAIRTPAQAAALIAQQARDPAAFKREELARMAPVMANFRTYMWIEVAFILVGLALTLTMQNPFFLGIGMGMLVQGALMLPADITAQARGSVYQAAVARMP